MAPSLESGWGTTSMTNVAAAQTAALNNMNLFSLGQYADSQAGLRMQQDFAHQMYNQQNLTNPYQGQPLGYASLPAQAGEPFKVDDRSPALQWLDRRIEEVRVKL